MKSKLKSILITGGLGFIGSNLINKIDKKKYNIIVLDKNDDQSKLSINQFTFINSDIDQIEKHYDTIKDVFCVVHLASTSIPAKTNTDPVLDIQNEVIKNLIFFNFLSQKGIKNIIYPSSGGTIYGEINNNSNSVNQNPKPISYYGAHKLLQEHYLRILEQNGNLNPIILRISNPYGYNQSNYKLQGLIGTVIKTAINNNEIEIWGDGSIVRDYIYIDDLSDLIIQCISINKSGTFNVGSGEGHSINEILKKIEKIHGTQLNVKYIKAIEFDVKTSVLNIRETINYFKWQPKISIDNGIEKLYSKIKHKEQ